jgi:uncharacterized protein YecT (DUF1311 family)
MLLIALLLGATPVQTQADMSRWAGVLYAQADAVMTGQYKRALACIKGRDAQDRSRGDGFGHVEASLGSQRAWLRFRDMQGVIGGGQYAGGSSQSMTTGQHRKRLTTARTQQLKTLIWNR